MQMTSTGPVQTSGVREYDLGTPEWLSIVTDFRTETTRGVCAEVLKGLRFPSELIQNITLEIDLVAKNRRSLAYRSEGSGISELRRIVNRVTGDGDRPHISEFALAHASLHADHFLDRDLCPNLRARFFEAWLRALDAAALALVIGANDPMELPYAPPNTILPGFDYDLARLGDVWHDQTYTLDDVRRWLDAIRVAEEQSRIAFHASRLLVPPAFSAPTRCSHLGGYMTYAPVSVPD